MDIVAQILSILGCAIMILSFQFKNNRHLFIAQALSALTFGLSYVFLGTYDGAVMNVVALTNGAVLFLGPKFRKKPIMIAICIGFALAPIISILLAGDAWAAKPILEKIFGIVIGIAQIVITIAMWKDDGKIIRNTRLFITSPSWLIYNIVVFSVGGIICEVFSIISIIVSFIRYGKDGFEK